MCEVVSEIPNINDVMTKQEQAKALFDEELEQVAIGENKKVHTDKQIRAAMNSLIYFFPDLVIELKKEHRMLSIELLKDKKKTLAKEFKALEMKVIAYADSCRDLNEDAEYENATSTLTTLQSVALK